MAIESDALNALRPELDRIPSKDIHNPNMAVDKFVHECERVKSCALQDAPHFAKIQYNVEEGCERLEQATGGVRESQRLWQVENALGGAAEVTWLTERDHGYAARGEAQDYIAHVLRKGQGGPDHAARLKAIRKGGGHSDMIADLGALADLALELAPALAELGYGADKITALRELHLLLNDVYGTVAATRAGHSPAIVLRNRAYVFALGRLNEIKSSARLAMREHPERLARYAIQDVRGGSDEPSTTPVPPVPPVPPAPAA